MKMSFRSLTQLVFFVAIGVGILYLFSSSRNPEKTQQLSKQRNRPVTQRAQIEATNNQWSSNNSQRVIELIASGCPCLIEIEINHQREQVINEITECMTSCYGNSDDGEKENTKEVGGSDAMKDTKFENKNGDEKYVTNERDEEVEHTYNKDAKNAGVKGPGETDTVEKNVEFEEEAQDGDKESRLAPEPKVPVNGLRDPPVVGRLQPIKPNDEPNDELSTPPKTIINVAADQSQGISNETEASNEAPSPIVGVKYQRVSNRRPQPAVNRRQRA